MFKKKSFNKIHTTYKKYLNMPILLGILVLGFESFYYRQKYFEHSEIAKKELVDRLQILTEEEFSKLDKISRRESNIQFFTIYLFRYPI